VVEALLSQLRKIIPRRLADAVRPGYHYVLAVIGAVIYRYPGRKLKVIGITGTNGKSTTANLAASVLEAGGYKVGLATTVNFQVGDEKWLNETKMTSHGRFQTQKLLRRMVDAGVTHAVLEVSSHAIYWHRTYGIDFETAVFTNLTRDHLDLHKTMDNYRATKGKLFQALAKHDGQTNSIVNGDDPNAEFFLQPFADRKFVYGQADAASEVLPLAHTVLAKHVDATEEGSAFQVVAEDVTFNLQVNLPGRFNISNALAAASVGLAYDVAPQKIARGIAAVAGVPGRMEPVRAGQPFQIVVDYAHTPDAFTNVLTALRETTTGRLITVFGATGDRDRGKRPDLGRVAAQLSDYLILTEEDPGSEDPHQIIEQIIPGIAEAGKGHADYEIQVKRRKAIKQALSLAKPGDTVALLAKGHETVMTYADGKYPWDDRRVAAEEWAELTPKSS
jgi:UDP-N-acetylmuramoyl-L-alanyl-D-glutamate--2,6-diaminopimelate ligase